MIPEQSGYRCKDDNGNRMAEYHILKKKQTIQHTSRVVRNKILAGEKTFIMFGHDECILKQFKQHKRHRTHQMGKHY
jgi:hypothetical protein